MSTENEHDFTRKMLGVIRENNKSKGVLINENNENNESSQQNNEGISPNQEELNQEYSKFRETITSRVEFTTFKIYPDVNNVIFGGIFQDLDGMEWQFSLEEKNGLYITTNNLQVDEEVIRRIQKLKGYYDNWADDWATKISTEYKNSNV